MTDGGDPNSGHPDGLAPGARRTIGYTRGAGNYWEYPYIVFQLNSYEPPVVPSGSPPYKKNTMCSRWSTRRIESVPNLLKE